MDSRPIIGHNIRRARHAAGMTQAQLAHRLEVPARQLSDWERGVHEPRHATIRRISLALGQPFHYFFVDRLDDEDPLELDEDPLSDRRGA